VIYGKNEAGKSTLHTFIRCMLFGLDRGRGRASRNDIYSHYEPWERGDVYGGRMRVEQNGIIYRIDRNFQKDQKSFTIVDETNGREIEPTRAFLDELLCGLTETTYMNTISIGQLKSATDGGMVAELRNYIANMNTTGSMALNITKATDNLRTRRKQFERQLHPDAAREYAALTGEIRTIEREIAAPEYENHLLDYQNMRTEVKSQLVQKQEEREMLLQKIATGRQALSAAQFTDEASIRQYQADMNEIWDEYHNMLALSESRSRLIPALIFFLLALLSAVISVFCITAGAANPLSSLIGIRPVFLLVVFASLAVIFFFVGGVLWQNTKHTQKGAASNAKILHEIFSRHLGDSTISDEAKRAFDARMEEFLHLNEVLVKSEQAVSAQAGEISSLQQREVSCDEVISSQQKTQWELEKKLDQLTHHKDQLETLRQELAENERIREEISAIDLALDTMTELSTTIRSSFGLYLNKTASEMIGEITGGVYNSMSVDENLNLFMNTPTKLVPVSQVSSGTMDQVYLALRLAAAKLIQSGHDQMPLVFDDSFVLYDDERLRTALKWLAHAYGGQILIFTCHQREAQMLTANQVAYHLIEI
jgi:uncharacterized protein YhaN